MVGLRKLAKVVAVAIRACANALVAVSLTLAKLAERIEKRSTSK